MVERIDSYQATIASAVEEQTATTNEMGRSTAQAAANAGEIAQHIVGVATAARVTTDGVAECDAAAHELARVAATLRGSAERFRTGEAAVSTARSAADDTGRIASGERVVMMDEPGKITIEMLPEIRTVVMNWRHQDDEVFRRSLERQLQIITEHRLTGVIVDTSSVSGTLSDAAQTWVATDFFPRMGRTTARIVVTVVPRSSLAKLVNQRWQAVHDCGFEQVEVGSLAEAETIAARYADAR